MSQIMENPKGGCVLAGINAVLSAIDKVCPVEQTGNLADLGAELRVAIEGRKGDDEDVGAGYEGPDALDDAAIITDEGGIVLRIVRQVDVGPGVPYLILLLVIAAQGHYVGLAGVRLGADVRELKGDAALRVIAMMLQVDMGVLAQREKQKNS